MAMHESACMEILDMGDIFPLEVLVENHLEIGIIRMG
jgi:hypothetical protein